MDGNFEYDVALSFAGEDREYVERVAIFLREKQIKVFYDKFEEASLWGKNLYTHLSNVYQHKAKYTVIFISKSYSEKLWTNHERENAQARAFTENKEYILPARFDNTEIPGILNTTGYVDLKNYTPETLSLLIYQKIISDAESFSKVSINSISSSTSDAYKKSNTFYSKIIFQIKRFKIQVTISILTILIILTLYIVPFDKSKVSVLNNKDITLISVLLTFNTLDDNKDFDTKVFVTLLNDNGQTIASSEIANNMKFRDSSTYSSSLPLITTPSKNELSNGSLKIMISPNGNDDWHFKPVLSFKFSDGTIENLNNLKDLRLSKNDNQTILYFQKDTIQMDQNVTDSTNSKKKNLADSGKPEKVAQVEDDKLEKSPDNAKPRSSMNYDEELRNWIIQHQWNMQYLSDSGKVSYSYNVGFDYHGALIFGGQIFSHGFWHISDRVLYINYDTNSYFTSNKISNLEPIQISGSSKSLKWVMALQ